MDFDHHHDKRYQQLQPQQTKKKSLFRPIAFAVVAVIALVTLFHTTRGTSTMSFEPKRESLKLVALRSTPVDPEGFSLALFEDKTVVDAKGAVSSLDSESYAALVELAHQAASLPTTGNFQNQWRVAQPRTSYPIDRILIPKRTLSSTPKEDYTEEYDEASVYGYDGTSKTLEQPTKGYTELPAALFDLLGAVEGKSHREGEGERNRAVIDKVKALLGNV